MNLNLTAKIFSDITPSMIGDDYLIINSRKAYFDKEAIIKIFKYNNGIDIENIHNFYIEELHTFGVNYGTNGDTYDVPFAIRFTCNIKGDINSFSSKVDLKEYVLVVIKNITLEDMNNGNLNKKEIDFLLMNDNLTESEKAWLKLQ
jgi:hypothetical protein